jgi:uncharacterized protein YutE (UPF0331/DUF86 family)
MVDISILRKKTTQITNSLRLIERYQDVSYADFTSDEVIQSVVEYQLFIIINQISDIANHIVVDNCYGSVESMSDGFKILKEKGFITEPDMNTYIKMVGFRNILAHQYIGLSKDIVYDVQKNGLKDIKKFLIMLDENFG